MSSKPSKGLSRVCCRAGIPRRSRPGSARARRAAGGSEMLSGTARSWPPRQPAPSSTSTAWAPGATVRAISARCRFIASVSAKGRTRAAPVARAGQTAPKDVGPFVSGVAPARPGAASPRPLSACPARRPAPRPGTRPRAAWPARCSGDGLGYRLREAFFKSLLGSLVGLRVARAHRQPAIAEFPQLLAHRRPCITTPNSASIDRFRSMRRHRTTRSTFGSGPASTRAASSVFCAAESSLGGPGERRLARPGSSALAVPSRAGSGGPCRGSRPQSCDRPPPAPARSPASASAARADRALPDAARSSAAVISRRVIAIAPAIPVSSASQAVAQTSADLGIPSRSQTTRPLVSCGGACWRAGRRARLHPELGRDEGLVAALVEFAVPFEPGRCRGGCAGWSGSC